MQGSQQNDSAISSLSQCFPGRTEFEIESGIRYFAHSPRARADAVSMHKDTTFNLHFDDLGCRMEFTRDEASLLCAHAMLRPGCVLE